MAKEFDEEEERREEVVNNKEKRVEIEARLLGRPEDLARRVEVAKKVRDEMARRRRQGWRVFRGQIPGKYRLMSRQHILRVAEKAPEDGVCHEYYS